MHFAKQQGRGNTVVYLRPITLRNFLAFLKIKAYDASVAGYGIIRDNTMLAPAFFTTGYG
jgi:hypothetical protein